MRGAGRALNSEGPSLPRPGRPVVYTTFLAYDEVAHHSGVERPDALATLARVDKQIARIARATADAPRPYHLVVLADHGQSQGATFRDRYGETLEQVVRAGLEGDPQLHVAREGGAVVIGARGVNRLDRGEVEGEDPLAPFGANAARHVKRTDGFPHCPDIVLNSTYWPETDEVAAFEELVGSHGGLGGEQSLPFAVVPDGFALPGEPIVGSEAMHRLMRRWLVDLGHDAYR